MKVLGNPKAQSRLITAAELTLIVVWAVWIGRDFLRFDPTAWPVGSYRTNVLGYFSWAPFRECGACVLWNGSFNGGAPALVETLDAIAHPVAVALVLLLGVVNGTQALVVAGLVIGGLAQWWLARLLHLGPAARVWSALMVIVGGHFAGRMADGLVEMVFSTASCSLAMAAALNLAWNGHRRATVLFGIACGLAALSGQSYMQMALALGFFPALLFWLVDGGLHLKPVWKEFVLGGFLALLIAAVLWVPLAHFFPNYAKNSDSGFGDALPLEFIPLNLVINDHDYFASVQYSNFIGWLPLGFGLLAFRWAPRHETRRLMFFGAAAGLIYLCGSAWTLKALRAITPEPGASFIAGFRFCSEMSMLAVPLLLLLAAWGVDLLQKRNWPALRVVWGEGGLLRLDIRWPIMALLLLAALFAAEKFGRMWMAVGQVPADYFRLPPQLKPQETAWVDPPYADWPFMVVGLQEGYKFTNVLRPWWWSDHANPPRRLWATREAVDPTTPNYVGQVEYLRLVDDPTVHYAAVQVEGQVIPCQAVARGGNIDVDCETAGPGTLTVYENSWSGWMVYQDGQPAPLVADRWLAVQAPPGKHHYAFRYRPWDVVVGGGLSLVGWLLAGVWWLRAKAAPAAAEGVQLPLDMAERHD